MSHILQDSLEILRQRATCPVCRTFYIQPRKLSNCSHVFCLQCIKLHLRANSHLNFPKCPMCRKPMLKPLSEIDEYEPARAEEDITNFVRQFEVCDVCHKPENPNLRCLDCKGLICTNCESSHRMFKPYHIVEPIVNFDRRSISNPTFTGSEICTKHSDQEAAFLCIVCLKTMCSTCKYNSKNHKECNRNKKEILTAYSRHTFLKPFGESDDVGRRNSKQPQIFHIKEISAAAFVWLRNIREELKECVAFLRKYIKKLYQIKHESKANFKCIKDLLEEAEDVFEMGKELNAETEDVLKRPKDADTAIYVLRHELRFQLFFQLRRKFPSEPYLIKAGICQTPDRKYFEQVVKCSLYDAGHGGILFLDEFQGKELVDTYSVFGDDTDYRLQMNKAISIANEVISDLKRNIIVQSQFPYLFFSTSTLSWCCIIPSHSPLYSCDVLRQMEDIPHYGNTDPRVEISEDVYSKIKNYFFQRKLKEDIVVPLKANCATIPHESCDDAEIFLLFSHFEICFIQPFKCIPTGTAGQVFAITGTRGPECGLETVFVYFNGLDIANAYGIAINTCAAKFNHGTGLPSGTEFEWDCPKNLNVKDLHNTFSQTFYESIDKQQFRSCYKTEIKTSGVPTDFLKWTKDIRQRPQPIPVKHKEVVLLCVFNSEIYCVYFEKDTDYVFSMIVSRLQFTPWQAKLHKMFSIKQNDTDVPFLFLHPMTITKISADEVIVVCSLVVDNKTFVMIRPNRCGAIAMEYLKVIYPFKDASVACLEDSEASEKEILEDSESSEDGSLQNSGSSVKDNEAFVEDSAEDSFVESEYSGNDSDAFEEDFKDSAENSESSENGFESSKRDLDTSEDFKASVKFTDLSMMNIGFSKEHRMVVSEKVVEVLEVSEVGFPNRLLVTNPSAWNNFFVEELEMSPNGDVFYILKHKQCCERYCVATKYLIND